MRYWTVKGQGNFGCYNVDECLVGHIATDQSIPDWYIVLETQDFKFYFGTLFGKDTSVQGNKCAHIHTYRDGFVYVLPMRSKSGAVDSLVDVVKDISITNEINCGKALEHIVANTDLMRKARKYNIHISFTYP